MMKGVPRQLQMTKKGPFHEKNVCERKYGTLKG
jgi:hypothetical protein